MDIILVINAGSSSLKFQIFSYPEGTLVREMRGQMDGIGVRPRLKATGREGEILVDETFSAGGIPDLPAAIEAVRSRLLENGAFSIQAVGHRVVHGGPDFALPVIITPEVLEKLKTYQKLAPLHQSNNLAPIRLAMEIDPSVPQVACFDTGFHRGHADYVECFALPKALYDEGVRRYGFHGTSYEYIAMRLAEIDPDLAKGKVIVAHLGSGASLCALSNGRSIDSTMGFTALDGLPMGTRPGLLDPGVVLYLMDEKKMSVDAVTDLLYREAGLKGLSGVSNDMRNLLESDAPDAHLAIEHFVYRTALCAGMMAAAMGGVDGIVFTAGVGENSVPIREKIIARLGWLGATLDPQANAAAERTISAADSRLKIYVIPTDEELMIARHTLALLGALIDA